LRANPISVPSPTVVLVLKLVAVIIPAEFVFPEILN